MQPIYLELRKFLASASSLEFDFSVKKVFLAMVAKVERVGANYSSTWDPLFLKALLARKAYEHEEEVPMAALLTLSSDLGAYAAADALLQSLRSSVADPVRRTAAAHAVLDAGGSAYRNEEQYPAPSTDDGEDMVSVLAIGARRFPPPPNRHKCGKPGVDGSDYLVCCGIWLAVQMFCNLCHCPTRKQQFDRTGCRGRWYFPLCGTDDETGASPGAGHEVATPDPGNPTPPPDGCAS